MSKKKTESHPEAKSPLILRANRLMEAFAKSDEERDFYLDKIEGFIVLVDLDKGEKELQSLETELKNDPERYCLIPKLTFFETKKIMEGFVHEKVYDIDTKEKLLEIIQSKEARENFLDFIYDNLSELEKWQQYYQERSRIRIIEWLRQHNFHFVFEEDLELSTKVLEKLKHNLFESKVAKDIQNARKTLTTKAKSYYSNEALNPRPKRGRPPKQTQKVEVEQQISTDIYTTVPKSVRPFLFIPDITSATEVTFSAKFESSEELIQAHKRAQVAEETEEEMQDLTKKLAELRNLSSRWLESDEIEENDAKEDTTTQKEIPDPKQKRPKPAKEPKNVPKKRIISKEKKTKKTPAKRTTAKKSTTKKTHLRRTKKLK